MTGPATEPQAELVASPVCAPGGLTSRGPAEISHSGLRGLPAGLITHLRLVGRTQSRRCCRPGNRHWNGSRSSANGCSARLNHIRMLA